MNESSPVQTLARINIHFTRGWVLFSGVVLIYLILTYISNQYVFEDEIYFRSYSDQLSIQSIQGFLDVRNHYWWIGYILIPFMIFLKILYAALCISIGAVFSNPRFKFKTIFKATLSAEVIFIAAQIAYLINVSFHLDTLTLETASNYYPLTLLSYFGTQKVVDWLQYPLQTLNLFEIFYMVAIAWLLAKQWKEDFTESLAVVFPSYAIGLTLWLVLVTFLTLQVS